MSLSIAQIRAEVLENTGVDATDLDDTGSDNLDLLINRAFWAICDEFRFKEKEQVTTFDTVASTRSYDILTEISPLALEAIQSVSYLTTNDFQHTPLIRTSVEWYEEHYNEQSSLESYPQKYLHHNGNLIIYPTPDQVYTITLYSWAILSDLSDLNTTVAIPQNWHESIVYGATYRAFLRFRDFTSAESWQKQYKIKISELQTTDAKEDSLNKSAGVRVIRPTYSVRH